MKNLISTSLFAILFTVTLFSCNKPSEPQPEPAQQIETKQNTINPAASQARVASRFHWKLAKTGIFGNGERVKLAAPMGMGYMAKGDFSYENHNGRGALVPLSVKFYNLRSWEMNDVDPAMLNTLRFNSYTIPAADGTDVDNVLYTHTIVAIKDVNGKYYMLEAVKFLNNFEIKVNIYEESYLF